MLPKDEVSTYQEITLINYDYIVSKPINFSCQSARE